MRVVLVGALMFLMLSAVCWAQQPAATEASPAAPGAPAPGGVMMPPQAPAMQGPMMGWQPSGPRSFGPYFPRQRVRVVFYALHALLMLSATYAFTALGVFLIRRSRPAA